MARTWSPCLEGALTREGGGVAVSQGESPNADGLGAEAFGEGPVTTGQLALRGSRDGRT